MKQVELTPGENQIDLTDELAGSDYVSGQIAGVELRSKLILVK